MKSDLTGGESPPVISLNAAIAPHCTRRNAVSKVISGCRHSAPIPLAMRRLSAVVTNAGEMVLDAGPRLSKEALCVSSAICEVGLAAGPI